MKFDFFDGAVKIHDMTVPRISTKLVLKDYLGTFMVRWGINRDNYRLKPGLYAVGTPDSSSDVFVTANYKLSFDTLRKNLEGINGWVLILDTKGINVWCAAGKGTFGTEEIIKKIREVSLNEVIDHKRIIVPQLGATGIAAHKVKEATGLNIHYGPVRAADIKKYISAGYHADREMRKVTFSFNDRIKLIPNDFIYGRYYLLAALAVILLISAFNDRIFSLENLRENWLHSTINIFVAYFSGIVITPLLLPWIPGRRFSLKGFYVGILFAIIMDLTGFLGNTVLIKAAWFVIIPVVSSFIAMNFTGSSTYTSLSGVKKEMKTALPLQISLSAIGIILLVFSGFIKN
jgi:hypothetical protein